MADGTGFDLAGKVALVTGASRGIGLAIAAAYAAAGVKVVITSRKQEALEAAAQQIRAPAARCCPWQPILVIPQAVGALVERAVQAYGGIDILVNNAATNPHFGPLLTAEESHWAKILDVNVTGYFRTIQACAPVFQATGGGCVINMASVAGREYQPGMGIYSVSKAGVIMLTKAFAVELAADNIRVNAIAPGMVRRSSAACCGRRRRSTSASRP